MLIRLSLTRRIVPWLLSALCLELVSAPALARPKPTAAKAKRRIAVGAFSGPKSDAARSAVLETLKSEDEYDVTDASDVAAEGDDKSYAKASRSLRVQAIVTGALKKNSTLVLSVHNGADGSLIEDVELKGGTPAKLAKNIEGSLIISVADSIAQGKAPRKAKSADDDDDDPPPKPKKTDDDAGDDSPPKSHKPAKKTEDDSDDDKEAKEDDDAAPSPAKGSDKRKPHAALEVLLAMRGTHRTFSYQDTLDQLHPAGNFPEPLAYTLPLGPFPFLDFTVYPFAFDDDRSAAADIGLIAGGELGIPLKAVIDQGGPTTTTITTSSHQYYIGLRDRLRSGPHEFGIFGAFGQHAYKLNGNLGPPTLQDTPALADITYTFFKVGADMRLLFGDVFFGGHAGTRIVLDAGGIKQYFPNTKVQAIDVGLSGGYALSSSVDLAIGFDLLRYGLDFNPIPVTADITSQSPKVAGGAVDQYLSGWLGLHFHF
ncbi:MAG TPA: hypothetical protein VGI10_25180 [Polyangiaceae bacterium]|jgi:hypothetical protein